MQPSPFVGCRFSPYRTSAHPRSSASATTKLNVRFVGGRSDAWSGVPRGVYNAVMAAGSKGTFFNHHIRDLYPYREERPA